MGLRSGRLLNGGHLRNTSGSVRNRRERCSAERKSQNLGALVSPYCIKMKELAREWPEKRIELWFDRGTEVPRSGRRGLRTVGN